MCWLSTTVFWFWYLPGETVYKIKSNFELDLLGIKDLYTRQKLENQKQPD